MFQVLHRRSVPFQGLRPRSSKPNIRTSSEGGPHQVGSADGAPQKVVTETKAHQPNKCTATKALESNEVWKEMWVWRACLAARMLNAMLVQTYFNPDEHWQSLEVAHRMVFGYGHLTWEWQRGLRSHVHPLIFAALYKMLALLHLDNPWFMRRAPRLLQSVFAAVGDLYLYKFSSRLFGERVAHWALFCQMVNWFNFFCMSRTYSNCMETVFTTMALYYWWPTPSRKVHEGRLTSRQLGLFLAGLACVMRPTSAIIWFYVGVAHLIETHDKWRYIFGDVLPIGAICLGGMTIVDRIMYGEWTFVITNFFKFNFLTAGGAFYGTHPWHWYFTQGLPAMAFTFLPPAAAGVWWSQQWVLAGLVAWVLAVYSTLGHKEFRFILPIHPLIMMFAGYGLAVLEQKLTSSCQSMAVNDAQSPSSSSHDNSKGSSKKLSTQPPSHPTGTTARLATVVKSFFEPGQGVKGRKKLWAVIIVLLLTNLPIALYTSLIHQRGGEAVMEHLANEAKEGLVDRVLFLMPCHATPYYSSLHRNVSMRFLDCSPSDKAGYVDEADQFKANPASFLYSMFKGVGRDTLPSHVVLYDSMEQRVQKFLQSEKYSLNKKLFHAHFPVDRELQGHVLVYTKREKI